MPLVSVIMPAYNADRYVDEAVESVLAQTFGDFEFLIVDDGSTDRSRAILEGYAARDRRISLVSRPNTGYLVALNEMVDRAEGEFLARMDADDVCRPDRFERQVRHLHAHPDCVAVGSAVEIIDPDGDALGVWNRDVLSHEQIDSAHLATRRGAVICHPSAMMRAAAVRALGGYRPEYDTAEDFDLFLRMAERGRLANLEEPLLKYRMHPASVCHTRSARQGILVIRSAAEAFRRRGRSVPETFGPPIQEEDASAGRVDVDLVGLRRTWGWWALGYGNVPAARKHARFCVARRPLSKESWGLLLCAIRGR